MPTGTVAVVAIHSIATQGILLSRAVHYILNMNLQPESISQSAPGSQPRQGRRGVNWGGAGGNGRGARRSSVLRGNSPFGGRFAVFLRGGRVGRCFVSCFSH